MRDGLLARAARAFLEQKQKNIKDCLIITSNYDSLMEKFP